MIVQCEGSLDEVEIYPAKQYCSARNGEVSLQQLDNVVWNHPDSSSWYQLTRKFQLPYIITDDYFVNTDYVLTKPSEMGGDLIR